MGTRQRILTIRLMEKVRNNPGIAKQLGIEVLEKCGAASAPPGNKEREK